MPSSGPLRRALVTLLATLPLLAVAPAAHGAEVLDVYALGDSITYGTTMSVESDGTWVPVVTPGGYRADLHELLSAVGVPHQFRGSRADNTAPNQDATGQTQHDGWGGFRVDQVAAALDGPAPNGTPGHWVTGTGGRWGVHPDVAVVHLGTNDIGQRYDPGTVYPTADGRANFADRAQRALFVQHLAARLDALVDKLQALRPGVRIVLSTVVPFATSNGTGPCDPVTPEYARAVSALVAAERAAGEKVVLADVWSAFVTAGADGPVVVPGLLSPDNVHPVKKGYSLMASVYRDAVLAAMVA